MKLMPVVSAMHMIVLVKRLSLSSQHTASSLITVCNCKVIRWGSLKRERQTGRQCFILHIHVRNTNDLNSTLFARWREGTWPMAIGQACLNITEKGWREMLQAYAVHIFGPGNRVPNGYKRSSYQMRRGAGAASKGVAAGPQPPQDRGGRRWDASRLTNSRYVIRRMPPGEQKWHAGFLPSLDSYTRCCTC